MPGLCVVVGGGLFRWTELQCSPVFSGNFTPSGHTVKVTSGHSVAKMEGFTFVVREALYLHFDFAFKIKFYFAKVNLSDMLQR